jgi:4-amino-4-deoxy-L-arabinose transferase-like glycosyltransferase
MPVFQLALSAHRHLRRPQRLNWAFYALRGFLGTAFLTKFYGVFMLFPLTIFYFHNRQKKLRQPLVVAAFFVPLFAFLLIWYQAIVGINILTIFGKMTSNFIIPLAPCPHPFSLSISL